MKLFSFLLFFLFSGLIVNAQHHDSSKSGRKSFESSLFLNEDTLTRNDYLISIEKFFQTLNKATNVSQPDLYISDMAQKMNDDDTAIYIIKNGLNLNEHALNLRKLEMFKILLAQIAKDTKSYSRDLHKYDSVLDATKKEISNLRKDTVMRHIFKDSLLKASFKDQLQQLGTKWRYTDSLVKNSNVLIDNTLAQASNNLIAVNELQIKAENLLQTTGSRSFSKERRYLWEPAPAGFSKLLKDFFKNNLNSEKRITQYYFSNTHNQLLGLFFTGLIFFFWVFYNFRSLKKLGKLDSIDCFHFQFVNAIPVFVSLIFMLNLAPLYDLDAPFVYFEFIGFLLMITLTVWFWKRLDRKLFILWIIFLLLFLMQSFLRNTGLTFYLNRWISLFLNLGSFILGASALLKYKKQFQKYKILILTAGLYTFLNFLAIVCNLFGRVTLMQIFSSTSIFAFIQTVSLIVFVESVKEALLLQIQSSRIRKDYPGNFSSAKIEKGIKKMVLFWAVIIWLIVFSANLNIYNFVLGNLLKILSAPREIGSFTFTFSGVILFLAIMWAANFLQKYIAYFFGDVGDEAAFDNKGQRSRLMITRLFLFVAGFLLAVAASGLAIDRITVILGALSVGIGLGLQSIVNNFVSGIILIFDRTLRIGDTVEIGDKKGRVKEISMRSSTLLTPEGAEIIIPNGDILSHNFVNWSLSNNYRRVELSFNLDKMIFSEESRREMMAIIKSSPEVLPQKEPEILINSITSLSTQLKIYFWCNDVTKTETAKSEVYASIYHYLQEKDIKIL